MAAQKLGSDGRALERRILFRERVNSFDKSGVNLQSECVIDLVHYMFELLVGQQVIPFQTVACDCDTAN